MNIFAYDPCPIRSALWLDDIRKNKMIVEGCQLLSTTVALLRPDLATYVYRISYVNHPCAIWARASRDNFVWLLSHTEAMHKQRGKPHKSAGLFPIFHKFCDENSRNFHAKSMTPFANCARNKTLGVDFTHIPNTHAAYRLYSSYRWQHDTIKLSWRYGEEPKWRLK